LTLERIRKSEAGAEQPETAWWGEHAARYLFATPHVKDRRVLDVACGIGYGVDILLKAGARHVVGVDRDPDAARQAQGEFRGRPGQAIVADGCRLPFPDGTFETVTSFETIEHLEQRDRFLAELGRVLKPEGLLVLSTPNANYTRPVNGKPRNAYHVHEYAPEELKEELQKRFARIELLGQVLDKRFVISPFWDDQVRLPKTPRAQGLLLLWRVLNKLPAPVRNRASLALWGHPFLPGEKDYHFDPAAIQTAPVLVALCRGALPA
jgi:SAM-dependent methyltransferase